MRRVPNPGRIRRHLAVVRSSAHETGLAFQPRQRLVQRDLTRLNDAGLDERIAERVDDRDRFRDREREIETRDTAGVRREARAVRRLSGIWGETGEHGPQVVAGHRPRQT
jgi:hypothetical protein